MRQLTVSAVLCTRNRPLDVQRVMPTLLATDAEALIVIDQSTGDETRDVLDDIGSMGDPRLTYVSSSERGLSRARNLALARSRTDIVAFTDDDCTVPSDWAAAYRRSMASNDYDLMFGPVVAPPDRNELVGWIPEFRPTHTGPVAPDADPIQAFGFGANFAVLATAAAVVGPFDAYLGAGSETISAGEDTDFGYRTLRAGFVVGIEEAPEVAHYGARDGAAFDDLRRNYQRGAGAMLDKHRRLGDRRARRRELAGFVEPLRDAAHNALRLRRPSGLGVARAFASGVLTARWRYQVDEATRLYRRR